MKEIIILTTISSIRTLVLKVQTTLRCNEHVRVIYMVKFLYQLQSHYYHRIRTGMCENKYDVVFEKTA